LARASFFEKAGCRKRSHAAPAEGGMLA
jgi:hypothetical protein